MSLKATSIKTDYVDGHLTRAAVLRKTNDLAGALAAYEHILAIDPGCVEAQYQRLIARLTSL